MERVRCAPAVCRGIGQSTDDLQLLDDRAGPSVIDDQRQRVVVLGADVNEVNVEPVNLGHEVREGVQCRLALVPVVLGRPIAREFLNHCERHALRLIRDRLFLGPTHRRDALAEVVHSLVGNVNAERADVVGTRALLAGDRHEAFLRFGLGSSRSTCPLNRRLPYM